MNTAKFCPQCGSGLLPDSSVCPRCAFQVALGLGGRGGTEPTLSSGGRSDGRFVPPKPDQLAQHFPQLEILDLIGQGGMGAVYKARQRGLDRLVALKILPPEAARDPAFEERFRREGKALAKLNHPNIVSVFDSNEAGGLFYFIMEYVDGVNLRQAIQAGTLSAKEALAIVPQICDALQYAHDEGIVHRDIKPENVLIDTKGRVKIADFGLARLLGKESDGLTLTGTHQVMGTPKYMAPEQMEGTHDVDHRADIYSLGVVFYEMLTGELPLGRFAPPSKKVQVDVRLDEVVLRTLEKEPGLRYQQAGDVKTAVQTIVSPALMAHELRVYGREYRSKWEFFGFPLVHVATGIDPKTRKPRIAKGIIAIGDQAYGGLAIGGVACGLIAIGGVAFGGITFGGLSIGLMLAIGGAAVGLGAALGGCAIAPVAVGGCAVGYYAAGGAGFGVHPYAGNARDAAGAEFFSGTGRLLMQTLPMLGLVGLIFPISALLFALLKGAAAVVNGFQSSDSRSRPGLATAAPKSTAMEGIAVGCFLILVLGLLSMVPFGLLVLAYFRVSSQHQVAQQSQARADAVAESRQAERNVLTSRNNSRHANLDWTDEGPAISDRLRAKLGLSDSKGTEIEQINQALREVHRDYVTVETKHTKRESVAAHEMVIISMPEGEIEKLQQQLWNKVDPLLNPDQQAALRQSLPVVPKLRNDLVTGDTMDEAIMPGILGWGKYETRIELFKGGDWFEWEIVSQGMTKHGNSRGLDPRWKRFWKESPGT
jgi:tRNA A-37 threonylcarbamoyl transferase component Bud32